jgi:hypothetical protein
MPPPLRTILLEWLHVWLVFCHGGGKHMKTEFRREAGNTVVSEQGFEVAVEGGMAVTVEYREAGTVTTIPAERLTMGYIGLFMDWAAFPPNATPGEQRQIFERVVRALRFMRIPIGATEVDPSRDNWPLPPLP